MISTTIEIETLEEPELLGMFLLTAMLTQDIRFIPPHFELTAIPTSLAINEERGVLQIRVATSDGIIEYYPTSRLTLRTSNGSPLDICIRFCCRGYEEAKKKGITYKQLILVSNDSYVSVKDNLRLVLDHIRDMPDALREESQSKYRDIQRRIIRLAKRHLEFTAPDQELVELRELFSCSSVLINDKKRCHNACSMIPEMLETQCPHDAETCFQRLLSFVRNMIENHGTIARSELVALFQEEAAMELEHGESQKTEEVEVHAEESMPAKNVEIPSVDNNTIQKHDSQALDARYESADNREDVRIEEPPEEGTVVAEDTELEAQVYSNENENVTEISKVDGSGDVSHLEKSAGTELHEPGAKREEGSYSEEVEESIDSRLTHQGVEPVVPSSEDMNVVHEEAVEPRAEAGVSAGIQENQYPEYVSEENKRTVDSESEEERTSVDEVSIHKPDEVIAVSNQQIDVSIDEDTVESDSMLHSTAGKQLLSEWLALVPSLSPYSGEHMRYAQRLLSTSAEDETILGYIVALESNDESEDIVQIIVYWITHAICQNVVHGENVQFSETHGAALLTHLCSHVDRYIDALLPLISCTIVGQVDAPKWIDIDQLLSALEGYDGRDATSVLVILFSLCLEHKEHTNSGQHKALMNFCMSSFDQAIINDLDLALTMYKKAVLPLPDDSHAITLDGVRLNVVEIHNLSELAQEIVRSLEETIAVIEVGEDTLRYVAEKLSESVFPAPFLNAVVCKILETFPKSSMTFSELLLQKNFMCLPACTAAAATLLEACYGSLGKGRRLKVELVLHRVASGTNDEQSRQKLFFEALEKDMLVLQKTKSKVSA